MTVGEKSLRWKESHVRNNILLHLNNANRIVLSKSKRASCAFLVSVSPERSAECKYLFKVECNVDLVQNVDDEHRSVGIDCGNACYDAFIGSIYFLKD